MIHNFKQKFKFNETKAVLFKNDLCLISKKNEMIVSFFRQHLF
jgi:hypothetical protein